MYIKMTDGDNIVLIGCILVPCCETNLVYGLGGLS